MDGGGDVVTDAERSAILAQARETIARIDADRTAFTEQRAPALVEEEIETERDRLDRMRAEIERRRAPPTLDTMPTLTIEGMIASERERWHNVLAEMIALERKDAAGQIAALEARLAAIEAAHAKHAGSVVDLLPPPPGVIRRRRDAA
jgi:hypothetical protein